MGRIVTEIPRFLGNQQSGGVIDVQPLTLLDDEGKPTATSYAYVSGSYYSVVWLTETPARELIQQAETAISLLQDTFGDSIPRLTGLDHIPETYDPTQRLATIHSIITPPNSEHNDLTLPIPVTWEGIQEAAPRGEVVFARVYSPYADFVMDKSGVLHPPNFGFLTDLRDPGILAPLLTQSTNGLIPETDAHLLLSATTAVFEAK